MSFSFYSTMQWFEELTPNQQIIVASISFVILAMLIIFSIKNAIEQKQFTSHEG